MKLHELKQKRNTIATDMRALHDKIGDATWTDEQRTQWNAAKSELDSLDERISREEELRRHDQTFVNEQEPEQRQRKDNPEVQAEERRAAAFDRLLRHGFGELTAEERQAEDGRLMQAILWALHGLEIDGYDEPLLFDGSDAEVVSGCRDYRLVFKTQTTLRKPGCSR